MKIDASLARGLTNRLFVEADIHMEKSIKTIKSKRLGGSTRKAWFRDIRIHKEVLKHMMLTSYLGGSKRNPYFVFCVLSMEKDRNFNDWQEKCIGGLNIVVDLQFNIFDLEAQFYIGEHAITRLIERARNRIIDLKKLI